MVLFLFLRGRRVSSSILVASICVSISGSASVSVFVLPFAVLLVRCCFYFRLSFGVIEVLYSFVIYVLVSVCLFLALSRRLSFSLPLSLSLSNITVAVNSRKIEH